MITVEEQFDKYQESTTKRIYELNSEIRGLKVKLNQKENRIKYLEGILKDVVDIAENAL